MYSVQKESGWPLWPLFAAIPVVLAVGFVLGMATATYLPDTIPAAQAAASNPAGETQSGNAVPPQGDSSWVIPSSTGAGSGATATPWTASAPPVQPGPPPTVNPSPVTVYFQGTASTIADARAALRTDYWLYRIGSDTISVDYETMRQAGGGVSLVGMISVKDYGTWVKAVQTEPDNLKSWLEQAAARVLPASTTQGFHIDWAVVDVVRSRPDLFSQGEVTALDNRSFLVIRSLAATMDHKKATVALRPLLDMASPAVGGVAPWATYGPVINFDSTDLYRPSRALEALPLNK